MSVPYEIGEHVATLTLDRPAMPGAISEDSQEGVRAFQEERKPLGQGR